MLTFGGPRVWEVMGVRRSQVGEAGGLWRSGGPGGKWEGKASVEILCISTSL